MKVIEFIYASKQPSSVRLQTTDNALSLQTWLSAQNKPIESYCFILYVEQPYAQRFLSIFRKILGEKASIEVFSREWKDTRLFLIPDEVGKRIFFQSNFKLSNQYFKEIQPIGEYSGEYSFN